MLVKLMVSLIISLGLISCGGGPGKTDNGGGGTDNGNGNCVAISAPTVGAKIKQKTEYFGEGTADFEYELELISFSNTMIETNSTSSLDTSVTVSGFTTTTSSKTASNVKSTFTVDNHMSKGTKTVASIKIDTTVSLPGAPATKTATTQTITSEYAPYILGIFDEACENQTWTDDYVVTITSTALLPSGVDSIVSETINYINTVEAINVAKTVPAGSFTTYQLKVETGTGVSTSWIDIASGTSIAREDRDNSGVLKASTKAITYTHNTLPHKLPPKNLLSS